MIYKGIRKSITAFTLAAVMAASALPAVPANAEVSEFAVQDVVSEVGAPNAGLAPVLAIKETEGSGQEITEWTLTYGYGGQQGNGVPESVVEYDKETKRRNTYAYTMYVLAYEKGDRTKPVIGSLSTDRFGKKVVDSKYYYNYTDMDKYPSHKNEFDISFNTPGKKEVIAYIFDNYNYTKDNKAAYEAAMDAYNAAMIEYEKNGSQGNEPEVPKTQQISRADYMIASAPLELEVTMEASITPVVTSTSVKLDMSAMTADGFEVYRKIGKNYVKVGSVASRVYTDKGLVSNTTYSYKVRPFYYDKTNNTTSYGKYTTIEATTTGSALNLHVKLNKKNKAELTWTKVKGATKYEIYRKEYASENTSWKKGDTNSYNLGKRIATVKKSKKKYTDKTILTNRSYYYTVRAILATNKKVKKDKVKYVEQSKSVSSSFSQPSIIRSYSNNKGDLTLEWGKVYGADGYLIEKKQDNYQPVKKIGSTDNAGKNCYCAFDGSYIYYNKNGNKYCLYKIENGLVYDCSNTEKSIKDSTTGISSTKNINGQTEVVTHVSKQPLEGYKVSGNLMYQYTKKADKSETVTSYEFYFDTNGVYEVDSNTGDIKYNNVSGYDDYVEYKKLSANKTSIKIPAEVRNNPDKTVSYTTQYRICAYKGNKFSSKHDFVVESKAGSVSKVTAKKEANGIRVSWKAVDGAAYYEVYRVPTSVVVDDKDWGVSTPTNSGEKVTEYVGAKPAVAVNVAEWNARYEADKLQIEKDQKAINKSYNKDYRAANIAYQKASKEQKTGSKYYKAELQYQKDSDIANNNYLNADKDADAKYQEAYKAADAKYQADYKAADEKYQAASKEVSDKLKADQKTAEDNYNKAYEAAKALRDTFDADQKAADEKYQADYKAANDAYLKAYQDGKTKYDADYKAANDAYTKALADYNSGASTTKPYMVDFNYPYEDDYYPVDDRPVKSDYFDEDDPKYDAIPDWADYSINTSYYKYPKASDYYPDPAAYYPSPEDYDVYSSDYSVKYPQSSDYLLPAYDYYPSYDDYKLDYSKYVTTKLEENKTYHYQNFSYARDVFPAGTTSILDYCGELYYNQEYQDVEPDIRYKYNSDKYNGQTDIVKSANLKYTYNPIVNDDKVVDSDLKAGVSYTYYVVAYMATAKTKADYNNLSTLSDDFIMKRNTTVSAYNQKDTIGSPAEYGVEQTYVTADNFKYAKATVGCKTIGTATYTNVKATRSAAIKKIKATKGKVTITIKKKVKGASYYKVYRSTKKKGNYTSVGETKNAKTLKIVDSSTTKGKTYYYKIVAVVKNEANGEVESKASAIKKVKAK